MVESEQQSVAAAPAGGVQAAAASERQPRQDGIRDTIEAIIVAFIFAFVFRAFVVEAFVIPTGSMAPGLYGLHGQHRCALCGYPFAFGLRERVRLHDGRVEPGTLDIPSGFSVGCPNCGWSGTGNAPLNDSEAARVLSESGDRILVLKWPYDVGGDSLGPKRWDVVVFKDPQDGETNFIKRLLGLPGEVLQIVDGDLYVAPKEAVRPDIIDALSKPPDAGDPLARRLSDEQRAALAKVLRIQRKTRVAQQSLWMVHYDHDYQPDVGQIRQRGRFDPPRWVPREPEAAAWNAATPVVRFEPRSDQEYWLDLSGKPIEDFYGYNSTVPVGTHPVGDVKLSLVLFPRGSDGHAVLSLRRGELEFRARIEAQGVVTLEKRDGGGVPIEIERGQIDPLRPDRPLQIEFENLDYRVALRVNGDEVLATHDSDYSPNVAALLAQASRKNGRRDQAGVAIGASGLPLEIRHLAVCRDVYYRSDARLDPRNPITNEQNSLANYPGWGTEGNPIFLRDDPPDYFCCGDNSPQSKDSRLWWEVSPMLKARAGESAYQLGTVPGDQMIGRAFFVYWPSGIRLMAGMPAVIPNVGMMRIIR